MKELRFHRSLYLPGAVEEATKTFGPYATVERADEANHFVVRVTSESPARERKVAGELANFALGASVRDLGAA